MQQSSQFYKQPLQQCEPYFQLPQHYNSYYQQYEQPLQQCEPRFQQPQCYNLYCQQSYEQPQQKPYYQQNYFDERQPSFQPFVQTDNTPRNLEEPTLEELMRKMTETNIKFQEWADDKLQFKRKNQGK